MIENFKVTVDKTHEFDINQEALSEIDCIETSAKNFHLLHENTSYKAEILKTNFNSKSYTIKLNNTTYSISIEDEIDQLIKSMGFEVGVSKQVNEIKAPMPGLILEIHVEAGQDVNEDDTLLILEAMKMENAIASPRSGIIKSITVKKGDAVEKNQLLIEFE